MDHLSSIAKTENITNTLSTTLRWLISKSINHRIISAVSDTINFYVW